MKSNRKKTETYRFNGHPYFDARSIFSVKMADLEVLIEKFEAKLADPNDPDDKKWSSRWLERFRKELQKKRVGLSLKGRERRDHRRTNRLHRTPGSRLGSKPEVIHPGVGEPERSVKEP